MLQSKKYFVFSIFIFLLLSLNCVVTYKDAITTHRENELKNIMNTSVNPCDDFYEFACGNYKTVHPIPDYLGNFDVLNVMSEKNYKILKDLLTKDISKIRNKPNPNAEEKAKIFYDSCRNIKGINERGLEPLLDLLNSLGDWPVLDENWLKSDFDWVQFAIDVKLALNNNFLFQIDVLKDSFGKSGKILPAFMPPITMMQGENSTIYSMKILKTLKRFNVTDDVATRTTKEIVSFEKELQELMAGTNYSTTTKTISEFETSLPTFGVKKHLFSIFGRRLLSTDSIVIMSPEFFERFPKFIERQEPKTIVNYVLWNVVDYLLPVLDTDFVHIHNSHKKQSQGTLKSPPRWRHCIEIIIDVMNTATTSMFMKKQFSPNARKDIEEMLNNLKSIIRGFLENNNWPGENIRNRSLEKLDTFTIDMSYEKLFKNDSIIENEYSDVLIDYDKFFESYVNLKRLLVRQFVRTYDTQPKEVLWFSPLVNPQASNSYFDNKMLLHPGFLQSPFYHENFTKLLDYSGLGLVLAHEIFHCFDAIGAQYNSKGEQEPWWDEKDYEEFKWRTECFNYEYENTNNILISNDENIGDSMGLKFAYKAYDNWLESPKNFEFATQNTKMSGVNLSSRQMFFVAAAQTCCATLRPEPVENKMSTDMAAKYRVIGMIRNSKDFAKQFQCPQNSPMNPINKCTLW